VPHRSTRGRDPSPSARIRHSGKRLASPSARVRHSGKRLASPSAKERHLWKSVLQISPFSHIIFCLLVPLFPECHGLLGTRGTLSSPSATLGEEFLPRVPDIWHSRKPGALGEFPFSRSDGTTQGRSTRPTSRWIYGTRHGNGTCRTVWRPPVGVGGMPNAYCSAPSH
jgi:hypothetical protein